MLVPLLHHSEVPGQGLQGLLQVGRPTAAGLVTARLPVTHCKACPTASG